MLLTTICTTTVSLFVARWLIYIRTALGKWTVSERTLSVVYSVIVVGANDYKWTWKAIEFELAFLYEVFFTSNEFLHFYQAKGASIWALASFIGLCLVGVATAIPGTMASRHRVASTGPPNAGTVVVGRLDHHSCHIGIPGSAAVGAVDPVLDVKLGEGRLCLQVLDALANSA